MGIIVLAIAIIPLLGIGGMQLYRAEQQPEFRQTSLLHHLSGGICLHQLRHWHRLVPAGRL